MADNPKLIIELEDRTNASGMAATNPGQPGGANVPGTNTVDDFQRKITEQGAGGTSQQPTQSTPTPDLIDSAVNRNQTNLDRIPTSSTQGYQGPQPASGNLFNTVQGLVQADPNVTAGEISSFLGVSQKEAQDLINAARSNNQQPPSQPPPVIPTTPPSGPPPNNPNDPYGGLPSGGFPRPSFEPEVDPASGVRLPTQGQEDPYSGIGGGRGAFVPSSGPTIDPVTGRPQDIPPLPPQRPDDGYGGIGGQAASVQIPSSGSRDTSQFDPATGVRLPSVMDAEVIPDASGSTIGNVINRAINLAGFGSTPLGQAANVLPAVLPEAGLGATGTAIASTVGAALPAIGIAAAGIGLAAAGYYAMDNEARRAVEVSRQFSPETAAALAESEVRQVMANVRSASVLGDEAADYVSARSRISTATQGIRDIISEPFVDKFTEVLTTLADVLEATNESLQALRGTKFGEIIKDSVGEAFEDLMLGPSGTLIFEGLKKITELLPKSDPQDPLANIEGFLPHLPPPPPFDGNAGEEALDVQLAPVPGLNL